MSSGSTSGVEFRNHVYRIFKKKAADNGKKGHGHDAHAQVMMYLSNKYNVALSDIFSILEINMIIGITELEIQQSEDLLPWKKIIQDVQSELIREYNI